MKKPFATETANYTLYGVAFGFLFPLFATIFESINAYGAFTLQNAIAVQSQNILLWIIDSAPFWLGLFARFGGIRQDIVVRQRELLEEKWRSLDALSRDLQAKLVEGEEKYQVVSDRLQGEIRDRLVKDKEKEAFARFPSENPMPVFRVDPEGLVLYSNRAGVDMLVEMESSIGLPVPASLKNPILETLAKFRAQQFELAHKDRTFLLNVVPILQDKTVNVYASDATRLKKMERDLIQARDLAEKANRAKSEFLSRMSHELRTPMNAILGFSQLMEMEAQRDGHEKRLTQIRHILKAGLHLLELINEVLDLSSIDAGKLSLSIEPVDLNELTRSVVEILAPIAHERRITLHSSLEGGENIAVLADRTRLRQVLLNLVSNAIKYNRDAGTVTLTCRKASAETYLYEVSDTGPGIPLEKQKDIFTPFERLGAEDTSVQGTGIGLSITKRLMEMMNGSIGFDSRSGEGSRFFIEIPASSSVPNRNLQSSPYEPVHFPKAAAKKKSILYIEDNPNNLDLVEQLLSTLPEVEFLCANSGPKGIQLAERNKPDLILMDIQMPDMDGFEALARLKEIPDTRNIPVIAVSANAMASDKKRAESAGFRDYITKPIDVSAFFQALKPYTR